MSLLVLSSSDVDHVSSKFTPKELQDLMARVFHLISSPPQSPPLVATPHRTSIPMQNHTALFMPARLSHPALHGTTLKAVCVPRKSGDTRGLPASTIVLDEDTGAVKAIVNARSLTALRNAAGSLLSTTLVGLHHPTSVVTFGAGKQIEAHLDLHLRSFPSITSCTIVNRTLNARVQSLQSLLAARFPRVSITLKRLPSSTSHNAQAEAEAEAEAEDVRNTVRSASLIICATPSASPLFPSSWVRTGTHVVLIGSYTPAMREVDRALVRRAIRGTALVDSRAACALEAGELIDAGVDFTSDVVEMGERVALALGLGPSGSGSGEVVLNTLEEGAAVTSDSEKAGQGDLDGPITMFKSVGVGVQDVAIACAVVAKAEEMGIGTVVADYDAPI
ncbi:putative ornithine cyclodeaminase/mu-crystallin family protein [Lyophyllum shimeji]|uniref:Ornithine cyclodeaminase/mu-crystallin family protein n=1 Tax=Lyophyllum shimeji TaxID=47721 RepID=A0A9P3PW46_LYOSH|nr:putative ornithine cyclodeaminase/mu-crystallin family protein [Lyophyllum shimeji]